MAKKKTKKSMTVEEARALTEEIKTHFKALENTNPRYARIYLEHIKRWK